MKKFKIMHWWLSDDISGTGLTISLQTLSAIEPTAGFPKYMTFILCRRTIEVARHQKSEWLQIKALPQNWDDCLLLELYGSTLADLRTNYLRQF